MLEPLGQCLTYDMARRIAGLRASEDVQARFDDLADKNTAGTLSPGEHAEYESLVAGVTFISILQAKHERCSRIPAISDEAGGPSLCPSTRR